MADHRAAREGWKRSDPARGFRLDHWDYDAARLEGPGFDYDPGPEHDGGFALVREATAGGEAELIGTLREWRLSPGRLRYHWETGSPR